MKITRKKILNFEDKYQLISAIVSIATNEKLK